MKYFNFNLKKYDSKILSWNKTKLKQQQKRIGSSFMFHWKSSVELGALTFSLTFKIRTQSSNHIYSTWDAGLETGSTNEWTRFRARKRTLIRALNASISWGCCTSAWCSCNTRLFTWALLSLCLSFFTPLHLLTRLSLVPHLFILRWQHLNYFP